MNNLKKIEKLVKTLDYFEDIKMVGVEYINGVESLNLYMIKIPDIEEETLGIYNLHYKYIKDFNIEVINFVVEACGYWGQSVDTSIYKYKYPLFKKGDIVYYLNTYNPYRLELNKVKILNNDYTDERSGWCYSIDAEDDDVLVPQTYLFKTKEDIKIHINDKIKRETYSLRMILDKVDQL